MRSPSSATISHFSHPHPLHLTNPKTSRICSACKKTLETEPLYTCRSPSCTTTFSLHLKCSQLPQTITHPCHHHHHPLTLLPISQNPNGVFTCNGCGKHGDSFLYSCKDCGVNIHVACAKLPLLVSHRSHCHQLNLVFSSPYGNDAFRCDVCGVVCGSKCWLYRCGLCGFDAHVLCVTSKVKKVVAGAGRSSSSSSSTTDQFEKWFVEQVNNKRDQILQEIMGGGGGGGGGGNMNNPLLQPMMGGGGSDYNQMLQAMMSGGGGGGGNYNQMLQAMMSGGGGGYNQLLQAMMSGGGGGDYNQMLQAMMSGGGGGDYNQMLQAMMGGGGGMDLSSVLGNFGGLMGAGFGGFGF
ncbi:putative chromatin regulator PHD family [Helianthus annuus]|uniref:Chromatin regulator PHD family n=1 Tax=Helianthus annuus TaxID=4232 RepID=A0A251S2F3_HELAN|nr:protein SHI RELATED SEQUENCE 2 [Helianthus annuus]KAF5760975.1 putative chromatin regulator PHD family [Helianthus annuus]KAJ0443847.1 putative chromatin regulator PHD family [Helianthus annuus]KAJ0461262.1 putative chromatin regulator PHD family [Helianthus annuus]KAJ0645575.1 putative chromatin regulator PHD family [Helianthus annuus]KAJ0822096.1 putative chromatin regulator PHD family [Helianthus annuus]